MKTIAKKYVSDKFCLSWFVHAGKCDAAFKKKMASIAGGFRGDTYYHPGAENEQLKHIDCYICQKPFKK